MEQQTTAELTTAATVETATEQPVNHEKTNLLAETEKPIEKQTDLLAESEQKIEHETLGQPDSYDFSNMENVEIAENISSAFSDVAKELDLSQNAAEKILKTMSPILQEHNQNNATKLVEHWAEQTKQDSEIGGNKLNENTNLARKTLDRYGSGEFKEFLSKSGIGNHPEVIRFLSKIGKSITIDTQLVTGKTVGEGRDPNKPKDFDELASTMYPTYKN